jgi:hypothetical protein
VTSSRKLDANRINARASTGPRSAKGKARSAANARWHGLTVPIDADHSLADRARALACLFAGSAASPKVSRLAAIAANAQIDIDRIRQAARDLMSRGATRPPEPADISVDSDNAHCGSHQIEHDNHSTRDQQQIDEKLLDQIRTLAEYESRAISRRNRALQDIDCQRLIEAVTSRAPSPRWIEQPLSSAGVDAKKFP